MNCHNVFHVSLLEPTANNAYPRKNIEPTPPVAINSEDEYFIEARLESQIHRRKLQYLMNCFRDNLPDWEPAEFDSKSKAMDTFHKKYPNKLGPLATQL
jgi:hypothetical protein